MSDIEKKEPIVESAYVSEGSIIDVSAASPEQTQYLMSLLGYNVDVSVELDDRNFNILLSGISGLAYPEAVETVNGTIQEHQNDRNFPPILFERFLEAPKLNPEDVVAEGVSGDWAVRCLAGIMLYSSPYPEVRSSTNFWDNDTEPCETIRVYFLATLWLGLQAFINQFFEVRMPGITFPGSLTQMLIVPCGKFLAKVLPDWGLTVFGTRYSLNPGPWSSKEQALYLVMLGEGGLPYVNSQVLVQKLAVYYNNEWATFGYQFLLMVSTQFLGFGLAGIFRNILVYPAQNIYMTNFSSMALNNALMAKEEKTVINGWKITRYHFFGLVFVVIFLYEWLPLYLMGFLSVFNWLTWIAPANFNLAAVTGFNDGLGFNPIPSFDWNIIGTSGMVAPFFSTANSTIGIILGGLTILGVYYANMYNTAYLPINSNALFTNTGDAFSVRAILTDNILDGEKYQEYSPPYYTAANLVTYGAFFAIYTSLYVSTLLYDWRTMWDSVKQVYLGLLGRGKHVHHYKDPHSRMMTRYKETPQWWFVVVLLISLGLGIAAIKAYPTTTPVWGIFLALGLSIIFIVPISILYSRTTTMVSINVLVELIVGYALPGRGTALMIIKAFGLNTQVQAVSFVNDLKVAHYTKVPPRAAFRAQLWATTVIMFIALGTLQFQLTGIEGICTKALKATSKFTCPDETTYFSASVVWGVIGPKRIFDSQYPLLKWCFLIGAVAPLPFWAARKWVPKTRSWLKHIEINLIIFGFIQYAPYNLSYYLPTLYVAAVSVFYLKRRYTKWFEKYNYVLAAAINSGTAFAAFIIFWAVQYHPKDLSWWGNDVSYNGVDGTAAALLPLPEQGFFGPAPGYYDF